MSSEERGTCRGEEREGLARSGASGGLAAWHGVLKSLVITGGKAACQGPGRAARLEAGDF